MNVTTDGGLDWWLCLLDSFIHSSWLHSTDHCHTETIVHGHVSISRYLAAAFNRRRSSPSGFPNCPRPQLPVSKSNSSQQLNPSSLLTHSFTNHLIINSIQLNSTQLNSIQLTVLLITFRHRPHRKHRSFVAVYGTLHSNGSCLAVCSAVVV
jgi:hypothetical protein